MALLNNNTTFNLEDYARYGLNFLNQVADKKTGQPYFNVFLTYPAEVVHDWADFGDLTARYLEAAILVKAMTGEKVPNEERLKKLLLSYFSETNGLSYRPKTIYSKYVAELFDQGRTLFALCTWYMDSQTEQIKTRIEKMISGLTAIAKKGDDYWYYLSRTYTKSGWHSSKNLCPSYLGGGLIRPLVKFFEITGYEKSLVLAGKLTNWILKYTDSYGPDGSFKGHVHGSLSAASSIMAHGVITGNKEIIKRMNLVYVFIRANSTSFGYVPELLNTNLNEHHSGFGCETCSIMDYIELGILLAKNGYPEYWGDMEKTVRNHLVESQILDGSWLPCGKAKKSDTDLVSYFNISKRVVGGFAGWSAPDDILGILETFDTSWVQKGCEDIYLGKIRAIQNCCGPAGLKTLYLAWQNIASFYNRTLTINFHIDRNLPEAEITGFQPYQGKLVIKVKKDLDIKCRIPESSPSSKIVVSVNGNRLQKKKYLGCYLFLNGLKTGDKIVIEYPLNCHQEKIQLTDCHRNIYEYKVSWKGDTVTQVVPSLNNPKKKCPGWSKKERTLFLSNGDRILELYQRNFLNHVSGIKESFKYLSDNSIRW